MSLNTNVQFHFRVSVLKGQVGKMGKKALRETGCAVITGKIGCTVMKNVASGITTPLLSGRVIIINLYPIGFSLN